MEIRVCKNKADTILFKFSHTDAEYEVLKIGEVRRQTNNQDLDPAPLYPHGYHCILHAKYQDLQSLCSGTQPVVNHPDYQSFYRSLHH